MPTYSWSYTPPASGSTNPYTWTHLLASAKRRGMIPNAAGAISSTDLLAIANEELQSYMVDVLMDVGEEYFVSTEPVDYSITASQAAYAIPERAIDGTVRTVQISTDNGTSWATLPRLEPTRTVEFAATGNPVAYKVEGNYLVLVPAPSTTSGTLRIKYHARPNRLVATDAVGEITVVDAATKTVTVGSTLPATFSSTTTYDLVRGGPHFDCLAIDEPVASITSNSITFTNALPSALQVGDFVCLAGESPIPQLPVSLHDILVVRTVGTYLFSIGELNAAGAAEAMCERKKKAAIGRMKPRTQGSPRVVINPYGPGYRGRGR